MLIKAEQKFVRMSPRKLRLVANAVRGIKKPEVMIAYLERIGKRASSPLLKTVKQALANATKNMGLSPDLLSVKELQVTGGPIYKRFRPVARGMAHSIKKRTSQIRVILEAQEPEKKVERVEQVGRKENSKGGDKKYGSKG